MTFSHFTLSSHSLTVTTSLFLGKKTQKTQSCIFNIYRIYKVSKHTCLAWVGRGEGTLISGLVLKYLLIFYCPIISALPKVSRTLCLSFLPVPRLPPVLRAHQPGVTISPFCYIKRNANLKVWCPLEQSCVNVLCTAEMKGKQARSQRTLGIMSREVWWLAWNHKDGTKERQKSRHPHL